MVCLAGIIAVETATTLLNIPADPGAPDTSERTVPQAGQVWFTDSALKTAHAMEEFDREGLPLVIMANWRGFSGGQRDLFEGVLQVSLLLCQFCRVSNCLVSWRCHRALSFKATHLAWRP